MYLYLDAIIMAMMARNMINCVICDKLCEISEDEHLFVCPSCLIKANRPRRCRRSVESNHGDTGTKIDKRCTRSASSSKSVDEDKHMGKLIISPIISCSANTPMGNVNFSFMYACSGERRMIN